MYYCTFEWQLCPLTLIGDEEGLQRLYMHTGEEKYPLTLDPTWIDKPDFFQETIRQLEDYAKGKLSHFNIKLNPQGTTFQQSAWTALTEIPYGQSRTYGEQAAICGNPKASRAIGSANGKNPIPVIIPCHRVIGSNGKLTGFAFGLDIKKQLLALERRQTRI